ncbi:uncharacterized protein C8Q71DRAFT_795564 [Rhodofomes roseus]|uniref:Uncharacterized protein n=1 Tax=Rhodofomes roseus TaxID=34475 RepID=A0ABQ8KNG5_9APHY|nr:uncharacterized protein C8Q71DRAFT_795564 [Rhodofomes roseus]KAH9839287.1 hypothetical protein C8Q71DRAFT_795564 [Rhodofomes roseus]
MRVVKLVIGIRRPRLSCPDRRGHPAAVWRTDRFTRRRLGVRRVPVGDGIVKQEARTKKTRHACIVDKGRPCDCDGTFLPPGTPPPPRIPVTSYNPFENRAAFQFAELVFKKIQASYGDVNELLRNVAAYNVSQGGGEPPFEDAEELYSTIDAIPYGDAPWESFTIRYTGEVTPESPSWKRADYVVHNRNVRQVAHNMIGNEGFDGMFDTTPYQEYTAPGVTRFSNMMSGEFAYRQATTIAQDPLTHGSMLTTVILGADKTTVSVGTGGQEFHPVYMSIGNVHNSVRRAHKDAIIPVAFLAIPKAARGEAETDEFRTFRKQLYHASLAHILSSLQPYMQTYDVVRCPDGHFRRVIYDLGPFIADYPEQVVLSGIVSGWCPKCLLPPDKLNMGGGEPRCREHTEHLAGTFDAELIWITWGVDVNVIPFTTYFPRADIYELLTPDLLHQLIKGTFKDHLVEWVEKYLYLVHSKPEARRRMDDIDRRIAAAPQFPGLRRFPEGRNFKQWTGNDSKALMKVYLPAIEGHVPDDVVRCFAAYLDFCYLARRSAHDDHSLAAMQEALGRFHRYRTIFETVGVRPEGFSLPRQHALVHYITGIRLFGSPNGVCSSITESKHIRAVKEPWRRSSRNNPLSEMLRTNQRLDKLSAARAIFQSRQMLDGDVLADAMNLGLFTMEADIDAEAIDEPEDEVADVDGSAEAIVELPSRQVYMRAVEDLAAEYQQPDLLELIRRFLFDQLCDTDEVNSSEVELPECPQFFGKVAVFRTAHATFSAPSELSGNRGMHRELIRSNPSYRGHSRYDTVLVSIDANTPGMQGMAVARVTGLMVIPYRGERYQCALIDWFDVTDQPDDVTGMYVVQPEIIQGQQASSIVHLDSIFRAVHLMPVFRDTFMPLTFHFSYSLDAFESFYINRYGDYHSHECIV